MLKYKKITVLILSLMFFISLQYMQGVQIVSISTDKFQNLNATQNKFIASGLSTKVPLSSVSIPTITGSQPPSTTKAFENSQKSLSFPQKLGTVSSVGSSSFISKWNTSITNFYSSSSNQISLPLQSTGTYNFVVNWGDGSSSTITSWNQAQTTHTYAFSGVYTINITGTILGWSWVSHTGDFTKIIEISQWGNLNLGNSGDNFDSAYNLKLTASDSPDLTGTTNLEYTFANCWNIGSNGTMNSWNVSQVVYMKAMFLGAISFNQPISNWNVSRVTDMSEMFYETQFNQPISNWKVSRVQTMQYMFGYGVFNQPLNNWDVSSVTNLAHMFDHDSAFNQPLNSWDVSKATDMQYMFYFATAFNQPIGSWVVPLVSNMTHMFMNAQLFNQPLNSWNMSSITDFDYMFYNDFAFNQPLNSWDVSHITRMDYVFYNAQSFNGSLNPWNVSKVTSMKFMFWNDSSFNQPLGSWDVSHVTNMSNMFWNGISFDQPLYWNITSVSNLDSIFHNVKFSFTNYDFLLNHLSSLHLHRGFTLDAGLSQFSSASTTARSYIINYFAWIINDGGFITVPSFPLSVQTVNGVNNVFLDWTVPSFDGYSPITGYNIYRSLTGDSYTLDGTVVGTVTIFNDTTVVPNQIYYYIVKAVNIIGESGPSLEVSGHVIFEITVSQSTVVVVSTSFVTITNSSIFSALSSTKSATPGFELLFTLIGLGFIILFIRRKKKTN